MQDAGEGVRLQNVGGEKELAITGLRMLLIVTILLTVGMAASVVLAQPTAMSVTRAGVGPAALSAPGLPAIQAVAGLMLSPPAQTVQVQTTFTLDVVADCGTSADTVGVELTFDPMYLQVVTVTADESRFPQVLRNRFDNSAGTIYYDAGSLLCHSENSCPSGAVRMATVTFRAVATTLNASSVGILGQVVWSGEPIFDGVGAASAITIIPPATDTPTPTRTATPTAIPGERAFLPLVLGSA